MQVIKDDNIKNKISEGLLNMYLNIVYENMGNNTNKNLIRIGIYFRCTSDERKLSDGS